MQSHRSLRQSCQTEHGCKNTSTVHDERFALQGYIKEGIIAVIIFARPTDVAKGIRVVARHS